MHTIRVTRRVTIRAAVLTSAVVATVCAGTAFTLPAYAADGDGNGITDYSGAQQVLQSGKVQDAVSHFLVASRSPGAPGMPAAADGGTTGVRGNVQAAPASPPRFSLKDPVPLYEVSPDFVAGKVQPTAQNALRLSYLTARVSAADGHQAAVLLAPGGNGTAASPANGQAADQNWQLAGIQDGDAEVALAEQGTAQAHTFTEPQIHAWYRLTAQGTVEPLNQEAVTGLGGKHSVTLAAYQKLVAGRYGDKLPGSAYDRRGLAGGYGLAGESAAAQPAQSAQSAMPAAKAAPSWASWSIAGGGALAAAGAFVLIRRRRTAADG